MAATQIHTYKVAMTCEGCSGAVQRVLGKLKDKGIEDINISLPEQRVKVKTSMSSEEIFEVLKKTGKDIEYIKSE